MSAAGMLEAPTRTEAGRARPRGEKPRLVFFHSNRSGRCRRVEGFLAQVLQHRRNHETFTLYRVEESERPDLLDRFGVETVPAIAVVEENVVRGRLDSPRGCREIESFLAPWLR